MQSSNQDIFDEKNEDEEGVYNRSLLHVSVLDSISKTQYTIVSLLPIYLCVLIAIGYPKLISNICPLKDPINPKTCSAYSDFFCTITTDL